MPGTGRNDPCPCGSGKKYKKCCLPQDETQAQAERSRLPEKHLTAELRPDVDEAVDRLLERLERSEGKRVQAELEALHKEHPDHHTTNYAMGVYRVMVEEDLEAGILFFQEAVRIFPRLPEAHYNLGSAYFKMAHIREAVEAFRKAIGYSSQDDGIAGLARTKLRELEEIVLPGSPFRSLDAYMANECLFNEAFEHLSAGRCQEAAALFKKVLEHNPNHVQSYGNLGLALAGLGRRAAALECLDKALALDPDYEPARNNRQGVETMREGEALLPQIFAETEFYREKAEAEVGASRRSRPKFKWWRWGQ